MLRSTSEKVLLVEEKNETHQMFCITTFYLGFDPRKLLSLRHFPKFLRQRSQWKNQGGSVLHNLMILSDYSGSAGEAKGHYFHQDFLVAGFIFKEKP